MQIRRLIGILSIVLGLYSISLSQTNFDSQAIQDIVNLQEELGVSGIAISNLTVSSSHTSSNSNLTHVYLTQMVHDIEITGTSTHIHYTANGEEFKTSSNLVNVTNAAGLNRSPFLTIEEAFGKVGEHFGLTYLGIEQIIETQSGPSLISSNRASSISLEDIPSKLVYVPTSNGNLELAWDVVVVKPDDRFSWDVRVSAMSGDILDKKAWTLECNFGDHASECGHSHSNACKSYEADNAHTEETKENSISNPDSYRVFAVPLISPDEGAATIVVNPADPVASPFGWHDTNGAAGSEFTITRGNNVYAQDDLNGNDGSGSSPSGGAALDFLTSYNFNNDPDIGTNVDASITNLFYWNNMMHDVWYQYGFDEASGNYQSNNYGNGGSGGDYVFADALDGLTTGNAFFTANTDGQNGRMEMFQWPGPFVGPTNFTTSLGSFGFSTAQYNPGVYANSGTVNIVEVDDNVAPINDGCENPYVNAAALAGNMALIERGNCNFTVKTENAEAAGAVAVIICNNVAGAPISMGGTPTATITIPTIMLSQADCVTLRASLPVTASIEILPGTTSDRTGDLDNGIIAHEYGHGISIRLAGGRNNSNCLSNNEQAGEGWSDWFGLMMTIKPGDVGQLSRGIATYVTGQPTTGTGIRSYAYSTDLNTNPHTYNDISSESVPHGVGSVFAAMLWEMTWELIANYGFDPDLYNGTGGNNIAMALVIEGLKLQPCSPGFVDMRDAILAADQALFGGANSCFIWTAFAKRGLGVSATQGNSNNNSDGAEAFDLPGSCGGLSCPVNYAGGNKITGTLSVSSATDYETDGIIESEQILVPGTGLIKKVDYDSKIHVLMNPPFTTNTGVIFNAFIDGCGGSMLQKNTEPHSHNWIESKEKSSMK